jgi:hypothetical protein
MGDLKIKRAKHMSKPTSFTIPIVRLTQISIVEVMLTIMKTDISMSIAYIQSTMEWDYKYDILY